MIQSGPSNHQWPNSSASYGATISGRPSMRARQPLDLLLAVEHEVAGVVGGLLAGRLGVVRLLVVGPAGDAVVLDAEVAADVGLCRCGFTYS